MRKAPLPHNKRNCYPPYPDHYLNYAIFIKITLTKCKYVFFMLPPRFQPHHEDFFCLPKKNCRAMKTSPNINLTTTKVRYNPCYIYFIASILFLSHSVKKVVTGTLSLPGECSNKLSTSLVAGS